ncbi:MerR family transcriptional regulator [Bradyrhizobium sp.]|uniref:MerR family transcriptional regulator n=1 Tax=Bradyrhizobium sp. TaxID=376 RepID=UPI002E043B2F|nr:MerR family transcriptional regulator [Bradyrhizobium sp.]
MDKAPDAFRTISEVADDLDIPQHVLRFWETRFTQIKPMKRSGGRRYYRPDDVDLLKGIRRLLYGEGYTIRGVQRILREHGVKSVQGLVDGSSAMPSFGAAGDDAMRGQLDADDEEVVIDTGDDEDEAVTEEPPSNVRANVAAAPRATPPNNAVSATARKPDTARLEAALQDLLACRQLLDGALKEG